MADSDQVGVYFSPESTRGVTPASPPFQQLRVTQPGITIADRTVESAEMRSDRMTADYALIAQDVSGEMAVEMSYGNADAIYEMGMCGTWANKAMLLPTAVTTTQFTVAAGGAAFRKGHVVRGSGFSSAGNNGLFALAADATGTAVTIVGGTAEASPPGGANINVVGIQGASGDMAALITPARLQITSGTGDFTTYGLAPGEWVRVGSTVVGAFAFATAACNGWARIGSITATLLTFDIAPPGWVADAGAGKTIRVTLGDRLDHGITRRYATWQRRFNDVAGGAFETSRGQEVGALGFGLNAQAIATSTASLMGDTGDVLPGQIAGATDKAAPAYDVMTTGSNMGLLVIDGVQVGYADNSFMRTLNMKLDNQLRQRGALGRDGSAGRGLGRLKIEGSAEVYFESITLAQKALTNLDTQFAWRVGDQFGRGILFDIPAAKIGGNLNVTGTNTDVMLPLTIKARRSPSLGYMMRIQRFDETL